MPSKRFGTGTFDGTANNTTFRADGSEWTSTWTVFNASISANSL